MLKDEEISLLDVHFLHQFRFQLMNIQCKVQKIRHGAAKGKVQAMTMNLCIDDMIGLELAIISMIQIQQNYTSLYS